MPLVIACLCLAVVPTFAQEKAIPEPLQPWKDWVTWTDGDQQSPTLYRSAKERIAVWPAKLTIDADQSGGRWSVAVVVFADAWVGLPGNTAIWPIDVKSGDEALPVVERNGRPASKLKPGKYQLSGQFRWDRMPQGVQVPTEIGMVALTIDGQPVPLPRWDANGRLWLRSTQAEATEENSLTVQVYRVLEDGIPTRLETDMEITVSGTSREENLGWVLPDGFQLSTVNSPIPIAVDDQGRMKAQVRAGKWTVQLLAFRAENKSEIRFAPDAKPTIDRELIAYRAKPEFRLAEIEGLQTMDVTQTTLPEKWRKLPLFQWDTTTSFQLTEKMRGMGLQRPDGLNIQRQFWLDESGASLTFQDHIGGQMQQIWRLDAAAGLDLGAVRIAGQGQLITENPQNGSQGVELRSRNLDVEAIGRVEDLQTLSATGWQTDVDSLDATFILPPGWRALAVFGADRVDGDWLTAWSLLDLFLLLIFALAVFRIWGFTAGVAAFIAFGLAYHEPHAPRFTWLFLLFPLALLKVVPEGFARKLVIGWKYVAASLLVINLVPFIAQQVQTAIYPQLEVPGVNYHARGLFRGMTRTYQAASQTREMAYESWPDNAAEADVTAVDVAKSSRFQASNLALEPAARIQTGPAQPQWSWNIVQCSWDGPVAATQTIRPVLIPMQVHRALTIVRVLLLVLLAAILFGWRLPKLWSAKATTGLAAILLLAIQAPRLDAAEFPDAKMLETLRQRLLEPADVYPIAADIARADLTIDGNRVQMTVEIHTATGTAVPLPGKLPVWSPLTVSLDGKPAEYVCRKDGYIWVVVPQGVHQAEVELLLPDLAEWEWTYELKPRRVTVSAPDWNVAGIGQNGVPNQQLLFTRKQRATEGKAAYDQKEFAPIIAVDRYLEVGLEWQVRTEVTRLSAETKAVSLQVPLLANENVLTSNARIQNGSIDVSLGAGQPRFVWTSQLPVGEEIELHSRPADNWIERWHLVTSPVWNMTQTGLAPVFEASQQNMIPVWRPWPGEQVTLSFNKPLAVPGDIITVQKVDHTTKLGRRQRTSSLHLDVECSVGSDFVISISPTATISSIMHDRQAIPVRQDARGLLVPVRPGRQSIEIAWKTNETLGLHADTGPVGLPVAGSNVSTVLEVPASRWVLWANGPLRGPAVRFWVVLVTAIIIALVLGGVSNSPLHRVEWVLLAIGLTQVHVLAALLVVAWLFALSLRGTTSGEEVHPWSFNLLQLGLVILTFAALVIFVVIVGKGLLGHPDMFIVGNQSSRTYLHWFQPRIANELPVASIISVSVWFYRLFMLFWALWLATSLLRWLKWGWTQFSTGGLWKKNRKDEFVEVEAV